jgi:hypothetical protein
MAFAETGTPAVAFTRSISQAYCRGVFIAAFGTARLCTHGDLLLGNCHSLIVMCCVISPSDYRGRRCRSLVPSPSIFNLSRCLVRSSLRITGQKPLTSVERSSCLFRCRRTDRSREVRDAAPTQVRHFPLLPPSSCRAASRHLIKASSAKGLVRKQVAPAFRARVRAVSTEKAVMKMNGTRYPSASKWARSSRPLIVGIRTSAITHDVSFR